VSTKSGIVQPGDRRVPAGIVLWALKEGGTVNAHLARLLLNKVSCANGGSVILPIQDHRRDKYAVSLSRKDLYRGILIFKKLL